ncbi:MAG: hypothetical protein KAV00_18630 [Phycisphaerae bacterium]|nr:hypothetical protein [Phycisphaerae bacterium]
MVTTKYWASVLDVTKEIPEEGPLARAEVEVWARWHLQLVNDLETAGGTYRGTSIRYNEWSTSIVVKAVIEGIPQVVFVTERDTTGCMRVFFRQLDEGLLKWQVDKYA